MSDETGRTETESERTERVLRLQDEWHAQHAGGFTGDAIDVITDMMRDPAIRQGPLGYAVATYGPPYIEARGPADPPGPMEQLAMNRARRIELQRQIALAGGPGRPMTADFYRVLGAPVPPGAPEAPRRPVNPFD